MTAIHRSHPVQAGTVFRFSRGDKTEELEGRAWAPGVVADGSRGVAPDGVSEWADDGIT